MEVKHQQHDTQKLIICHHHKGGKSQEDVYSFKLVIFLIIDLLPDGEITTIEFVNALVYVGATLFQMTSSLFIFSSLSLSSPPSHSGS